MMRGFGRHRAGWLALWCVPLMAAGCDAFSSLLQPREYVARAFPDAPIKTVAVAPFVNLSPEENVDTLALSDIFFREFQSFQGLILVPPAKVQAQILSSTYDLPGDGRKLAAQMGVDAVVFGVITSYEPYATQHVGIAMLMYTARDFGLTPYGPEAILMLQQSGRPMMFAEGAQPAVIVSARMFDSSDRATVQRIKKFARGFSEDENPLGYRAFVTMPDRFMQFVSHEMVKELAAAVEDRFAEVSRREE